jgi:DNA-directed RNA polymerase specialized sigma24 family protein
VTDLDVHLEAIRLGDAGAFARWLAGAERSIRESLRPLASRVDTEVVVQETMLRIWQVAPRVVPDGKPNSLLRFAVRVARNLAVSELRRTHTPVDTELDDVSAPTPEPPDPLLRRAIIECREALPAQPGRALTARLESSGGDPDEVIAERLGMRKNTFLQNFTRARKLLADCLRSKGALS